jgi:streptogrisin B
LIGINRHADVIRLAGRLTHPWIWVRHGNTLVQYDIRNVARAQKGTTVCTNGAYTGYHCGPVTKVNQTVTLGANIVPGSGTTVHHLSQVDVCKRTDDNPVAEGDSGGPVFLKHIAKGTLTGTNHSGCTVYFQGLVEAQNLLNVDAVTQ